MIKDTRKQSALRFTTLTNNSSLTASGCQNVEVDPNRLKETELCESGCQNLEVDPNRLKETELCESGCQNLEVDQDNPEDAKPSKDSLIQPPIVPVLKLSKPGKKKRGASH